MKRNTLAARIDKLRKLCKTEGIDPNTPEGRVLIAIIDALAQTADELDEIKDQTSDLQDELELMDEELSDLEDAVYFDDDDMLDSILDDDDDDEDDDEDDDSFTYNFDEDDEDEDDLDSLPDGLVLIKYACPNCDAEIPITVAMLRNPHEPVVCPECSTRFKMFEKP